MEQIMRKVGKKQAIKLEYEILKKLNQKESKDQKQRILFPKVLSYEEKEVTAAIEMEYIKGSTLNEVGFAPKHMWLWWMQEVARGLSILHGLRPAVIWCDCKPENLMIDKNNRIYLIDFDCACYVKQEMPRQSYGTRMYASPEQKEGRVLDERADIYGFGSTFLKMPLPFSCFRIKRILKKCVAYDKEERFQTASELLYELRKVD